MADEAQVLVKVDTKNTTTADEAPKKVTIASVFRDEAVKPSKDRAELATKIIAKLKAKGMDKNVRGYEIREDRVAQQISAMLRDIKLERGKEKGAEPALRRVDVRQEVLLQELGEKALR